MNKIILSILATFALLVTPTIMMAGETEKNPNSWVEEVATDFGTDSYDVDGCFC
ncbi:MAG: Unknown protein [uncultured Sulfurovum sp.]|uniref:Uncharacterized protein n=1 Tax=uncultured Sulfurovum sp. TaxID=269237 RepID=A0A6S6UHZ7_9BACT|nr:MAG: Unknown protein [uncultured Sulfurovum sp.]